ncbi:MAG TPA: FecR domain-containing protein [Sediminibacterium sp.]|nr:FecR domain-containing protein [Sediminibacterium sp.]
MRFLYTPENFVIRLQRFIENSYNRQDVDILVELIDESAFHGLAMEQIEGTLLKTHVQQGEISQEILERMQGKLPMILNADLAGIRSTSKFRLISPFVKWIAAAFLLMVAGTATFFLVQPRKSSEIPDAVQVLSDVKAPNSNKAMIMLPDGRSIYLGEVSNGTLARIGDVQLEKMANGRIRYTGSTVAPVYHTLTNPKGSEVIDVRLSDGTRIWLNSGSSITYPVAFVEGQYRKVNMIGEAYFEVASNKLSPFRVTKGNMQVEVHGTHFNINGFDDEVDTKVTLLEGSLTVSEGSHSVTLLPNQQAVVKQGKVLMRNKINIDQVIAWKAGRFDFGEGTPIRDILLQIARWYNVEIVYRGISNPRYYGSVSRYVNVSEVLRIFELAGGVHFIIEGNKIIVYTI